MDIILYAEAFMCKSNKENKSSYINVNAEVDVFSTKFINGDCEKKNLCVLYIGLCIIVIKAIHSIIWVINE